MGGYCGDSYYRTDKEYRRMEIWAIIFVILVILGVAGLIYFSPMFYA